MFAYLFSLLSGEMSDFGITTENLANSLAPFFASSLTIALALLLDKVLGEAKRYHYLVGFGYLAQRVEQCLNRNTSSDHHSDSFSGTDSQLKNSNEVAFSTRRALLGMFAWLLLVLPLPMLYWFYLSELVWYWQLLLDSLVLYLAIGLTSLRQHALQVYQPLNVNDLVKARHFTGYLVSRETSSLTPEQMSRATVESMLENGHDSVIASMVYYLIGGAPLVILHRFANTLDAMWGYKNPRFNAFGYASARLDDVLGFLSGKICTLLYALQSRFIVSIKNAYQQGNHYKSHNGGWVIAAGATVMGITLGGSANYHGKTITSVTLGQGRAVTIDDIPRSITVVSKAALILLLSVFIWQGLHFLLSV